MCICVFMCECMWVHMDLSVETEAKVRCLLLVLSTLVFEISSLILCELRVNCYHCVLCTASLTSKELSPVWVWQLMAIIQHSED